MAKKYAVVLTHNTTGLDVRFPVTAVVLLDLPDHTTSGEVAAHVGRIKTIVSGCQKEERAKKLADEGYELVEALVGRTSDQMPSVTHPIARDHGPTETKAQATQPPEMTEPWTNGATGQQVSANYVFSMIHNRMVLDGEQPDHATVRRRMSQAYRSRRYITIRVGAMTYTFVPPMYKEISRAGNEVFLCQWDGKPYLHRLAKADFDKEHDPKNRHQDNDSLAFCCRGHRDAYVGRYFRYPTVFAEIPLAPPEPVNLSTATYTGADAIALSLGFEPAEKQKLDPPHGIEPLTTPKPVRRVQVQSREWVDTSKAKEMGWIEDEQTGN